MARWTIRLWIKFAILSAIALLAALGIFYPALVPPIWHLRFPNGVHYHSTDIYVPPRWIANENGLTVRLVKYPYNIFQEIPQALISLTPASETAAAAADSNQLWEEDFRARHAATGTSIRGPVKYGSGAEESVCLESYAVTTPSKISASCRLFRGEWMMEFTGDPGDLDFFFENLIAMNNR